MIKPLEYAESILRSNPMHAYDIATTDDYMNSKDIRIYLDAIYIEVKALWLMSRFEEAVSRTNHLIEISQKEHDFLGLGRGHNVLGNIYNDLSNIDKALEHYIKGLKFSREIGDKGNESALLNNIGEIYRSLEDYDEALKHYKESMVLSKPFPNSSTYGVAQINIGEMLFEQGKVDEALDYCQKSIEFFIEKEDYFSIAYGHFLLSKIFKSQGEIIKAKKDLTLAIDIMRRLQDRYNLTSAYIGMIEILVEQEVFEEALEYIEDAFDIAELLNLNKEKAEIALQSAKAYEKMHKFDKSLEAYKIYVTARFAHEKEKEEEQLKNIKSQINIEKTKHEKEIYRLKNVELKRKTEEIEKLYNDMKIITNIGQNITSTLDVKNVIHLLYDNLKKLMDAETFGIYLYDEEKEVIDRKLLLYQGKSMERKPISIHSKRSLSAWVISKRVSLLINNSNELPKALIENRKKINEENQIDKDELFVGATMVVPLIMEKEVVGCIVVKSCETNAYNAYHFNLIKALASYITIAVINSQESQLLSEEIKTRIDAQNSLEVLNKQLSEMSYIDALTDIPNRRKFVDYFSEELLRGARREERLALLIIDIDYFKQYNDNYGHVKGDVCLTNIAKLLKNSLKRKIDFVARYGGDEFVVVLSDIETAGAKKISKAIIENVKNASIEHLYSPASKIITLTIGGIVFVPDDNTLMESIITKADKALYKAKEKGRNQICFYEEI